jgi:hypothetical protein
LIQIPKVRIQATKSLIFKQVHPLPFLEAIGDIAVNEAHRNNEDASRGVFIDYVQRKPDLLLYESLFLLWNDPRDRYRFRLNSPSVQ